MSHRVGSGEERGREKERGGGREGAREGGREEKEKIKKYICEQTAQMGRRKTLLLVLLHRAGSGGKRCLGGMAVAGRPDREHGVGSRVLC